MAEGDTTTRTSRLYIQDLTEDISQDALELNIERIIGVEIKNTKYMNNKQEAIITLDETISFDSEKTCTISGRDIKIVPMRPLSKPTVLIGWAGPPAGGSTRHQSVKKSVECSEAVAKKITACLVGAKAQSQSYPPVPYPAKSIIQSPPYPSVPFPAKSVIQSPPYPPVPSPAESHIQGSVTGKCDLPGLQALLSGCSLSRLEDKAQQSDDIQLSEEDWQVLKRHQTDLEDVCKKTGSGRVQVAFTSPPNVIRISGDPRLLQDVKTNIKQFLQKIVHKTVKFRRHGLFQFMKTGPGKNIIAGIESNCKSHINVTEVKVKDIGLGDVDEDRETDTTPKVTMEVIRGDLTNIQAGVLVNTPAGRDVCLAGCGVVSQAFCKAGGDDIQESYEAAVTDGDNVTVTQACGTLKCQHVFHMRIYRLKGDSYQQLEDQIYKCLQKASERKVNTIAFPTIGCGNLRYEPRNVVQCIDRASRRHESDHSCHVSKVIICAYDAKLHQAFEHQVAAVQHTTTGRPRASVVSKQSTLKPSGLSVTSFHITALSQSNIDAAVNDITNAVELHEPSEVVSAEYLDKFSQQELDDINTLKCDDVEITLDVQAKRISIVGSRPAIGAVVKAVTQKVHTIQESSDFVQRIKSRPEYLAHIAAQSPKVPAYWNVVKSLFLESSPQRVSADPRVTAAIIAMVEHTWDATKASIRGADAKGLTHTDIDVTSVEQIENPRLYIAYENKMKQFCMRAAKGSFEKLTSDPGETDVLTSTLGISELDNLLIPEINEHFLFHGVQQQSIEPILRQGIDFRLNNRAMFGRGAYFAESATKADQYADDRNKRTPGPHSMFLCRVLLGRSHIAKTPDNQMSRPPCLHHCQGACSHDLFDSVMGAHRNDGSRLLFREFVIFGQTQIYPAFLITYKRK